MRRGAFYILAAFTLGLVAACSHQWRQSNPKLTGAEVYAMLEEAESSGRPGDSGPVLVKALNAVSDHDTTTVYFNDGPRPGFPLGGAFAFSSLEFLPADVVAKGKVLGARVFFIEHAKDHKDYLILGLIQAGPKDDQDDVSSNFLYYSFEGQGTVDHGQYIFSFKNKSGSVFTLRSNDVDGSNLAGVIQLRAYNAAGGELGKFSSLAGYQ